MILVSQLLIGCDKSSSSLAGIDSIPTAPIIESTVLESWGYRDLGTVEGTQLGWDAKTYGNADVRIQTIKAIRELEGMPGWYCGLSLIEETYSSEELAQNRAANLSFPPPGMRDKMHADLVLREGFFVSRKVIILSTGANVFHDACLPSLLDKLKTHFGAPDRESPK